MNIFAFTEANAQYPGYVSVNRTDSGDVEITVRSAPRKVDGIHICSNAEDAGPGRCTPGGETCNNYCNLAPEKGPMQDSALACEQVIEGQTASFVLPAAEWSRLSAGAEA